jgi:hypothetical protein
VLVLLSISNGFLPEKKGTDIRLQNESVLENG